MVPLSVMLGDSWPRFQGHDHELHVDIYRQRELRRYFVSFARYSDLLVANLEIFIPHLYLAPRQGVTPSEICENVWRW